MSLEVAGLTMMIRAARIIPSLENATLCVQEISTKEYFSCKLRELPHASLVLPDSLQFGAMVQKRVEFWVGQSASGVSNFCLGDTDTFSASVYQESVCRRLLAEYGYVGDERQLPEKIAKIAKDKGMCNSTKDFLPSFKSGQHGPTVTAVLWNAFCHERAWQPLKR
jgi:hypothetical protein